MKKRDENGSPAKSWLHALVWSWRHLRGHYPADEAVAIAPFLQPTDDCIDIGAHAGSWSVPLAKLVPAGRVYAFEALPHYAEALRRLVRLFRLRNVVVLNNAVSDAPGTVEIAWRTKQGQRLTGNTHMATAGERTAVECVTVPAVTLDQWQRENGGAARVGFVKIDVEGAELLVLRGAGEMIARFRPIIFMEIVTSCCARYGYEPARLFELFESMSYDAYTVTVQEGRVTLRRSDARSYPGRGDVLLLPKGLALPVSFAIANTP
jgi:FkbM family methyltransferase